MAALNPHGFDFELWLFEQGIGASGSVRTGEGASTPAAGRGKRRPPGGTARQAIARRDAAARGQRAAAGVLAALAVGDQAAIDRNDWDAVSRTPAWRT